MSNKTEKPTYFTQFSINFDLLSNYFTYLLQNLVVQQRQMEEICQKMDYVLMLIEEKDYKCYLWLFIFYLRRVRLTLQTQMNLR
jgi:hypothetical protein